VSAEPRLIEREHAGGAERALIGEHLTIVRLRALLERVAASDATVMINGESGSGKEVVARAIHRFSSRRNRTFVPVNCAAIPHELLESEMFGHERGAFSGAVGARLGLFSSADGGTIFLDEIGEMPLSLQAKLLRVLEDGVVRALGSDRSIRVNARIIAATNADLSAAVKRGAFREDLYYRLQVVPLFVPPLRERRSDIPLLIDHFLAQIRAREPRRNLTISSEAMVHFWSYDWPGNVRELENLLERLAILSDDSVIDTSMLPPHLLGRQQLEQTTIAPKLDDKGINLNHLVRELEGRMINEALKRSHGNKQAAARLLGLKRTTFAAKLRRCGVVIPGEPTRSNGA
jgi:DNA-binding NtrC family response regulator